MQRTAITQLHNTQIDYERLIVITTICFHLSFQCIFRCKILLFCHVILASNRYSQVSPFWISTICSSWIVIFPYVSLLLPVIFGATNLDLTRSNHILSIAICLKSKHCGACLLFYLIWISIAIVNTQDAAYTNWIQAVQPFIYFFAVISKKSAFWLWIPFYGLVFYFRCVNFLFKSLINNSRHNLYCLHSVISSHFKL